MPDTTVSFQTVGCRLNQAETARLRAAFAAAGYRLAPFGAPCGVCVIHGCAVTARAQQDTVRLARRARRAGAAVVVVAGCPAEVDRDGIRAASGADLAVGQADKMRLPALLRDLGVGPLAGSPLPQGMPRFHTVRALVKVQDGCEFGCRYCIVPRARGPSRSRPMGEILDEVDALAAAGFREIVLTGANLGCYRDGRQTLPDLLQRLADRPAPERIRLSSLEVSTVEEAVIDCLAGSDRFCRTLHLPLQSGSDAVLRAMGRRYTARQFTAVAARAARCLPGLGLGTDVLVGFPGETPGDLAQTEAVLREGGFSNVHVFAYSPRPGTPAAAFPNPVPEPEKRRRAARLAALGRRQREDFARSRIGTPVSVLVESVDALGIGHGWTGEYLRARLVPTPGAAPIAPNRLVRFLPRTADGETLEGDFCA